MKSFQNAVDAKNIYVKLEHIKLAKIDVLKEGTNFKLAHKDSWAELPYPKEKAVKVFTAYYDKIIKDLEKQLRKLGFDPNQNEARTEA